MSTQSTRPAAALQPARSADCHHAREPFAAAFYAINQRRDISPTAKLVYAHLVTLRRTRREATQVEIGDAIGCSRHQVWRAIGELLAVELVQTIRYGLGRPNGYVLLGVAEDDLDGRATGRRPAGQSRAGQERPRAGTPSGERNDPRRETGTGPKRFAARDDRCPRCPHVGHAGRCSRCGCRDYGGVDYRETREGRLSIRT